MSEEPRIPPSRDVQSSQSVPAGGKGLGSTAIAIIVVVVAAVVILGSVGAYLLFRGFVDDIDDFGFYKYTEPIEHEFPAESYTAVEVSNVNGYVSIIGIDDTAIIYVDGLKRAHTEADLDDFDLSITEDEGVLILEVIHEDDNALNEAMDLDIVLPSDLLVLSAASVNGDMEVLGMDSVTDVRTTNGDLTVEVSSVDMDMSISSTNGDIEVHILTSLDATISMTTTNGVISLNDVPLDLTEDESDYVSGTLNSGGYELEIETTNGNIDLRTLV